MCGKFMRFFNVVSELTRIFWDGERLIPPVRPPSKLKVVSRSSGGGNGVSSLGTLRYSLEASWAKGIANFVESFVSPSKGGSSSGYAGCPHSTYMCKCLLSYGIKQGVGSIISLVSYGVNSGSSSAESTTWM